MAMTVGRNRREQRRARGLRILELDAKLKTVLDELALTVEQVRDRATRKAEGTP